MKNLILVVILFITSYQAQSQEAFVLNRTYRQGWVVWYPTNSPANLYRSRPISLVAKKTPNLDPTNWEKMPETPPTPAPTPVPAPAPSADYAKQSTVDSLLTLLKLYQAKQDVAEAKAKLLDAALSAAANDVKVLKQITGTLKVTQTGIPLMDIGTDGVLQLRSIRIAPTSGLDAKIVNGEIVIDKK